MTFGFDLLFFTWVTFGILFVLLARYGWGPIVEALQSREEKIQDDLTSAEEQREKAEQLLQERKEALNEAHSEAREIIEEAREKGEASRREIVQEARDKAESMIDSAEEEIESERQRAFQEVGSQVGELSIRLAERILKQEVDEDAHQQYVDEFLSQVESEEATVG